MDVEKERCSRHLELGSRLKLEEFGSGKKNRDLL